MRPEAPFNESPLISVITVVLNGVANLEQCIQSVRSQIGVSYEHIVIDGGSQDGSVEIIRRYANGLSAWVSEADHGISDAMNKGIARAQGEWLLFLHADDYLLATDSLQKSASRLVRSQADIVGFPILYGMPDCFRVRRPYPFKYWLNFKAIPHQGCFTRRLLFDRLGVFDTDLNIDMDHEFMLRALRSGSVIKTFDEPILSFMRSTGLSSHQDWNSLRRRFREERHIHFQHAPGVSYKLFLFAYWTAYTSYRWLRWKISRKL